MDSSPALASRRTATTSGKDIDQLASLLLEGMIKRLTRVPAGGVMIVFVSDEHEQTDYLINTDGLLPEDVAKTINESVTEKVPRLYGLCGHFSIEKDPKSYLVLYCRHSRREKSGVYEVNRTSDDVTITPIPYNPEGSLINALRYAFPKNSTRH